MIVRENDLVRKNDAGGLGRRYLQRVTKRRWALDVGLVAVIVVVSQLEIWAPHVLIRPTNLPGPQAAVSVAYLLAALALVVRARTWGYTWAARELRPENLGAGLLMCFLRRRAMVNQLPAERTLVRFEFTEPGARQFWLAEHQSFWLCSSAPR